MLRPEKILNKEFTTSFRGYDKSEVDAFLDDIMTEVQEMNTNLEELKKKNQSLEKELKRLQEEESSIAKTIVIAKQTADQMVSGAESKAREIETAAKMRMIQIHSEQAQKLQDIADEIQHFYEFFDRCKSEVVGVLDAQKEQFVKVFDVDKERESSEEIANILRLHEEAQQQVEKDMLQQKLVEQGVDELKDDDFNLAKASMMNAEEENLSKAIDEVI